MKTRFTFLFVTTFIMFSSLFVGITSCKIKNKGTDDANVITIWYSKTISEAEEPPEDWFLYEKVKQDLGLTLVLKALPSGTNEQNAYIREVADRNALPDIFKINHEALKILAEDKKIIEISEDIYQKMPERTKRLYKYKYREGFIVDGSQYALVSPGGIVKNEGLVIRKDWLDNLGLPVPVTINEFYDTMYAFTYNDPDKNGYNDTYGFGAYIEANSYEEGLGKRFGPIMGAFGVGGTWNAQTKDLNVFNPHFYEAISFINKMSKNKVMDPSWVGYKKEDFRNAWKAGKFGCMKEQYSALFNFENYEIFDKNHPEGEWIIIDPPVGPYGDSSVSVDSSNWRALAISTKAKDNGKLDNICRLLEWMSTEGYYYLMYGQEGINFVFDENGNVSNKVPNPELAYSNPERAKYRQLTNFVVCYSKEELRPQKVPFTTRNGKYIDPLEKLEEMQKCKWSESLYGFPSFSKDLRAFYKHSLLGFACGQTILNKESFDKWVNEFKAKGGTELQNSIKKLNDKDKLDTMY